ncbi:helix-turn-helix domain-containing protein [Acidovorax sp. FG27]|uniref:helix-turn-helix domain-containing protein n=1 Tax=Acidovorax sp. FG27 TaxID=3133652 RepID=UPI0030E756D4
MSEMLETEMMDAGSPAAVTAGSLLRDARQAAGVHIAALAVALKVSAPKLEALEADRHEVFPDVVFVRALASSVCRTLNIDPAPVLALLPQGAAPRLTADRGINASYKDSTTRASSGAGAAVPRSVVAVVLVLLLGALAMVFVPKALDNSSATTEAVSSSSAPGSVAEPVSHGASTAAPLPSPEADRSAPAAVPAPAPAAAVAAASPAAPASQAAPNTAAVASEVLVIAAKATSWVQVRSLGGGGTTQKTLNAGDRLVAPGSPPWAVVIGKADATTVLVRGQPLDIASSTRENVARFEVK